MLEQLTALAGQMGYVIRQEWLGGSGGGACEFGGRRYIFVDLALSALEQLEQVAAVLKKRPHAAAGTRTTARDECTGIRRAA